MTKVKKHAREKNLQIKEILGKKARYIGLAGAFFKCDCGTTFKRGMISEYKGKMYCSEQCVTSSLNEEGKL